MNTISDPKTKHVFMITRFFLAKSYLVVDGYFLARYKVEKLRDKTIAKKKIYLFNFSGMCCSAQRLNSTSVTKVGTDARKLLAQEQNHC